MKLSDALQIVRENIGAQAGDTYTYGDTILKLFIESSRAYIAENVPPEKIPLCQVYASSTLNNTASEDYRAFDFGVRLSDLTPTDGSNITNNDILDFSKQIQIEDVSASDFYNGRLYINHINAMIETHKSSFNIPVISEDYIPVLYDGLWFSIRNDFSPSGGWSTSDKMHIRLIVSPDALTESLEARRLPERYENYALQLAYADIMLTATGDLEYKNIKAPILQELGIMRTQSDLGAPKSESNV